MQGRSRILIAEDCTILRQGLRYLVAMNPDYEVVGDATDGLDAIRQAGSCNPDLVLLDLSMPKMNGLAAIKEIKRLSPGTKILILTVHAIEEYVLETFKSGANGYCLKDATHEELLSAIKVVLSGRPYISPGISGMMMEGYIEGKQSLKSKPSWETLTRREREVLKLVGEGYTSKEIADYLCISSKTVEKHRTNIMSKLGLHNVSALTAYAIEKGLVTTGGNTHRGRFKRKAGREEYCPAPITRRAKEKIR